MPRSIKPRCFVCGTRVVKDPHSARLCLRYFCSPECIERELGAIMSASSLPYWDYKHHAWVGGEGDFAGRPEDEDLDED